MVSAGVQDQGNKGSKIMLIEAVTSDFAKLQDDLLTGPIYPDVTPEEVREYLASRYDFSKAMDLSAVVADVEQMMRTWQVQITHPRYFGLFNPSVKLASVIADALVAMYNPQLAAWRTSPAANEIERHTLAWLTKKFGLPTDAIATFTTGGAEANFSAVVVALTQAFPRYGEHGLQCLSAAPTIYVSEEAHHSFSKIAHMTGLGRHAIRTVATQDDLRMDLADLERQIAEDCANGLAPLMVVGTAGTTAAGVIDPLAELGALCKRENLWFHVDAAWGGAAIISPALRHFLGGIELADSITCDAHKWFSVSMSCGMFFCRHAESVARTFRAEAAYMPGKAMGTAFDPYTSSVQWSRRFIGLKLFLTLAENGGAGQAAMIEHQTRMADLMREALIDSGWQIMNDTPLPLICFTRDGLDIDRFLASMREHQVAWMSEARIKGMRVLRACVTSFKTTEDDVRWVVGEMNRLADHADADQLAHAEY
jgi:aromatic-L-amino-acid/L-tryptophan decarboxylase